MINSLFLEFQYFLKYRKLDSLLSKYIASFLSILDILIIHNYNSKNATISEVTLKDSHILLLSIYLLQMSLYWNVRGIKIKLNFKCQ